MNRQIFKNEILYAKELFSKNLYSFGENPWLIATWVAGVIFVFGAVIFSFNEIACTDLAHNEKPETMVLDSAHIELYNGINDLCVHYKSLACKKLHDEYSTNGPIDEFLNSLYISTVTFTTLGFGDYRPLGYSKPFLAIEAIIGATLMALFVNAFARRTAGK